MKNHIPKAHYIHLNDDLSDLTVTEQGRHPLPDIEQFKKLVYSYGITPDTQVIVYDDWHGGIAARMWWMLRNIGHQNVAVLDGGWNAWTANDYDTSSDVEKRAEANIDDSYGIAFTHIVSHTDMEAATKDASCILDARAAKRYQGLEEPIDPRAGHIPSAISLPFLDNLDDTKHWKSKEDLRQRFEEVIKDQSPKDIIVYCGSGVTACHNILAMSHAGLPMPRLYVPSWSGWISDTSRQIVTA